MSQTRRAVIAPDALDRLVEALRDRGYRVLGPTVRDGAIVYDDLESADELPIGWTDRQDGGTLPARAARRRGALRLRGRPPLLEALSLSAAGAPLARQPERRRHRRGRGGSRSTRRRSPSSASGRASCTRSRSRTRVFIGGKYVDRDYAARRDGAFLVAVNCFEPGGTCFCTSMGTGPKVAVGLRPGADRAARRRASLPRRGGQRSRRRGARRAAGPRRRRCRPRLRPTASVESAATRMGRTMDTFDIRDLLARNLEHPRWDEVADPLPHLRELHARLPDVLLLRGRGRDRPLRPGGRTLPGLGQLLLRRLLVHPRRQHPPVGALALPAVDDAQARHVVRPVRLVGLRRLRPLHHLVPGRHRHHRGGRGDPRDGGRQCRDSLESVLADVPFLDGLDRRPARRCSPAARATSTSPRAEPLPRGRCGRHLLHRPPRQRRARDLRAGARACA